MLGGSHRAVLKRTALFCAQKEKVDIFLGNHTWNNDTYGKSIKLLETGENLFIDDAIWLKFLETYEERIKQIIKDDVGA